MTYKRTEATTAHATPSEMKAAADRAIRNHLQEKFAEELAIFSACVIGALSIFRILRFLVFRATRTSPSASSTISEEEKGSGGSRYMTSVLSARRTPLALGALFRNVLFRLPIPFDPCASIAELAFVAIYLAVNLVWLFIDTRDLTRMFYQDRAGHLGAVQMSLVVALAGKNNIISFLTGVSHEKLSVLHRAAARTTVLLLWMHAISRTVTVLPAQFDYSHGWMQAGAVGLVSFSLVVGLSLRPIRNMAYEFFLVSHILLIAIALISAIFHTKFRNRESYIWPAILVWGLDRLIRIGRLIFNNLGKGAKQSISHSSASVEILGQDTIRLTLHRRISWRAGQHAYVALPSVSQLPTEAHPFTIASLPSDEDGKDNCVVFIIRARSGFTARLRELAVAAGDKTASVPAYIDGPYGCPPNPTVASTCILIAGGSGVSFTLPLFQQVLKATAAGKSCAVKRLVFIWVIRDGAHLVWISKALSLLLENAPKSIFVDVCIYVTGPNSEIPAVDYAGSATPSQEEKALELSAEYADATTAVPAYDFLKMERGRPDLRKVLGEEIELASGHVQVNVAGPSPMTREIKTTLRKLVTPGKVLRGMSTVTLNVESFGMVNK